MLFRAQTDSGVLLILIAIIVQGKPITLVMEIAQFRIVRNSNAKMSPTLYHWIRRQYNNYFTQGKT